MSVLPYIAVALSMAAKDAFGTIMVVAESRGRDNLAGMLDAAEDAAVFFTTLYCVGPAITKGLTEHSFFLLIDMMIVSYAGTRFWTKVSRRIKSAPA